MKMEKKVSRENKTKKEDEEDEYLHIAEFAKDEEIHRINKKVIDLNIHDESERATGKQEYKFKLPHGATKN